MVWYTLYMVYTPHGIHFIWYTIHMVVICESHQNLSALFAADYILYTGGLFVNVKITK